MYKALVRVALHQGMSRLNRGDYALMLTLAHPDFELSFPGRNSWSTMFREPSLGRHRKATHVGISEGRAFADRFVAAGIQFEVEDILVNGPPWNTRVALRVHDFVPGPAGHPRQDRLNVHGAPRRLNGRDRAHPGSIRVGVCAAPTTRPDCEGGS